MNEVEAKLHTIFAQDLDLEIPSAETDLIATGLLDSMSLVDLLLRLEIVFDIIIPIADLDLDDFRSIASIVAFVTNHPLRQAQRAVA